MFNREEIQAIIQQARQHLDAYTKEHLGYLEMHLGKYDKHKSAAKRGEDWKHVEEEARKLQSWALNWRKRSNDDGGNGAQ